MTLQEMEQKYPEICKEISNNALAKERKRLHDIDKISDSLPAEMVIKAKYETFDTAEKLAFDCIIANKNIANNTFKNMQKENEESGVKEVSKINVIENNKEESKVATLTKCMNNVKGGK